MSIQRLDINGNSSTDLGPIFVYDMYGRLKKIGGTGSGGTGPPGPPGPPGPEGPPGPSNGIVGPPGPDGIAGPQGYQGPIGPIGNTGSTGEKGLRGTSGNQGTQGYQGTGTQGPEGMRGPIGPQGCQGDRGPRGFQGYQGTLGGDGFQGDQGFQGVQGVQGVQGDQGVQGVQGIQGYQGTGVQGTQGYQGTGVQGAQGVQGAEGVQGSQGYQGTGTQGFQGDQGPQGVQGSQGYQGTGTQGFQGTQGNQGTPLTELTISGTQNGINKVFILSSTLIVGAPHMFFINGQLLLLSKDYSISGTILTIHSNRPAPSLYDNLRMFAGIGNLIGSQGTQGDQGTNGTIGVDGAQGYQGTQGYQGIGVQGYQGPQGDQGPKGDQGYQGPSGSSDWTKIGNNIYNNNTGKVSIGAGVDLDKAQLSVRGIQNNLNGGIAITTTTNGTDWRMFASDANAVQNGNGTSPGFHITGASTVDSAFWIGGWSACVSNSFQSPTLSALATPMAIRGVTGQTGDFMQIRSDRTVTTGDIMTVKSTGLVTLPTVTNALITADATNKAVITKEYLSSYTTTQLASKMNNPSLTASYIPKALTATTIGNSRLLDINGYLGIGTVNTPLKDITLGSQANREIGVEESDSSIVGRDLIVTAGKTVNYQLTSNFVTLNQTVQAYRKGGATSNKDFYISSGSILYKQSLGSGNLALYHTSSYTIYSTSVDSSGNIYIATSNGIYKQSAGAGLFVLESGVTTRTYYSMAFHPDGHLYAVTGIVDGGGSIDYIYKRTNNTGDFVAVSVGTARYNDIACAPNGDVYASQWGTGIIKQASGTSTWSTVVSSTSTGTVCVLSNGTIYAANVYGGVTPYFYISTNNGSTFTASSISLPVTYPYLVANGNNVYAYSAFSSNIFFQNNESLGTSDIQGGTLKLYSGTGKGTGASDIEMWTGQVKPSGTDMQDITLRAKIDNTGLMTLPSVTNALIEADITGKSVATKEYVNNRLVLEKSGNYTLTNADSGGIIIFTASATLTIPNSLADGFECTFVTLASATLTVDRGSNILYNNTGTVLLPQLSFTLKRRIATDQYIATGSL